MNQIAPLSGAVSGSYNYNLDTVYTTPVANLANGVVRLNNSNQQLVTTIWTAFNTSDATPINIGTTFLGAIQAGDSIVLTDKSNPAIWQEYLVTASSAPFSTTQAYTVKWVTGGTPLVPGNAITFGIIPGLKTALGTPIFTPAPSPPSAPGQPYITYKSGSATIPATPLSITGAPIIPTSPFPPGGGVGSIGNPVGVPTFPPPTPPPIGTVPAGALVGPAVANAAVPPSTAGFPLLRYATGSATSPAANGYFPLFTTTTAYAGFPNNPPNGVPLVFANIWTNPSHGSVNITAATWATGQTTYTTASAHGIAIGATVTITGCTPAGYNGTYVTVTGTTGSTIVVSKATNPGIFATGGTVGSIGTWTVVTPPSTATTGQIILNGWGLPGPSGLGPGPPSNPNPPGAGLPYVFSEISVGHAESSERHGDAILPTAHIAQLHQQEPTAHSRRKRMSARYTAGGTDLS